MAITNNTTRTSATTDTSNPEVFEKWYYQLQNRLDLKSIEVTNGAKLVESKCNAIEPIHRWYTLKESYSSQLPIWVIQHLAAQYNAQIKTVLDPFMGSGTTGVALAQNGINVDGVEYNPFIRLVASTKAQASTLKPDEILAVIKRLNLTQPQTPIELPSLSTFTTPTYFRNNDLQVMLHTIRQLRNLDISTSIRDVLLVGIAAAIDDVANLRKDGRALRFIDKPNRPSIQQAISTHWQNIVADTRHAVYSGTCTIHSGTALNLTILPAKTQYDLVLYSPPYLNNFDYSEIYKLEMWLLDLISSNSEWAELRRATIRSHHSIKFPNTSYITSVIELEEVAHYINAMSHSSCLGDIKAQTRMGPVIRGYFDDMYVALTQQWHVLKPGGFMVYVVANSRHYHLPIATDIILATLAQTIGFQPLEIAILKHRNGRTHQKAFLRETAVIMQKPLS